MALPQDIDYFSLPVSLSQEVREILDRVRPSTVSLRIQSVVVLTVWSNYAADTSLYPPAGCCYTLARHNSSRSRLSPELRAPDETKGEATPEEPVTPKGGER